MPDFRRGADAIAKAQEKSKSSGNFRPFTPSLFWKDDGDEKYLLFLNPLDDIPTVEMISFIPVVNKKGDGTKYTSYEQVIARTDDAIGESSDPMVDNWDGKPRETCVAVAVELEPTFEEVEIKGKVRKRPTGFEVATTVFERRIRDEEGELTEDTEEVEAPVIGFITQSPNNFFNVVTSFDAQTAPIEDTAVRITRVGKDTSTAYTVDGFEDQEIDLAGLIDCVDGISYISGDEDEFYELLASIEDKDDAEAAQIIGAYMLDKRLAELIDRERYDELYEGIDSTLDKFGGKKKKGQGSNRKERSTRRSQRRSQSDDAPETEAETPEVEAEAPAEEPKPRRTRTRKPKEDAPADDADEKPARRGKQSDPKALNKLEELRARQAARKPKETTAA